MTPDRVETYACTNDPGIIGIPICPESPLAKKLAADCKAADEALEKAEDAVEWPQDGVWPPAWKQFRKALTARLKLNCAGL